MNMRFLTLVAWMTLSCATASQIPADQLERSEASLRGAEELGALAVPAAKLHMQMARDQTLEAKRLARKGDARAETMLARAQADAELAVVLAREAAVHRDALQANEDLKSVNARNTP